MKAAHKLNYTGGEKMIIEEGLIVDMYKKMITIRKFEEEVMSLNSKGKLPGWVHLYIGEEAVGVGVCSALKGNDLISSTHRGHGHIIAKGADIKYMFAELMGKANGCNHGKGGTMHISDLSIGVIGADSIVSGGVSIALGAALASKLRNKKQVTVAFYGDGGANQGVVHETMNMAAIWDLPIIFVCENNQYAVSTSVKYSTKIENLRQRAKAYGFSGVTVDGMDVLAVYNATKNLAERARSGKGPSLLECKTYRYHGHFTAEGILGLNYRTDEEMKYWKSRCPIKLWAKKLIEESICSQDELTEIDGLVGKLIEEAVEFARASKLPRPEDALKDMYATEYKEIPQKGWLK